MEQGIRPFHFWVQPILPLVYDDSLSYLEVLLKVKIKLNEVIDWANNYKDELYQYVDEKTQENLAQMQQILNQYQTEINLRLSQQDNRINNMAGRIDGILNTVNQLIYQFQQDINKQIAQFQLDTDTKIRLFSEQITSQIENNEAWVRAQIAAQTAYINSQLDVINLAIENNLIEANKYTDEKIKEALSGIVPGGDTNVIYPGDGKEVTIQIAIDRLFYDLSYFALTAGEYDELELTAQEYDNKNLTAYQYDLWARWYLTEHGGSGQAGYTFTPSVSEDGVISWTNNGGLPNPDPVNIKGPAGEQGIPGAPGANGSNGFTFTPSVSEQGDLSWTNNGGLPNPATVNLKGSPGQNGSPGETGPQGEPGKDATINGVNTLNIVQGQNINLSQVDNTLTISATGGGGSGSDIQINDTLVNNDGVIGVKTPTHNIVTQEEFNSLTEEQKNSGLYVIDDGITNYSNVYSTEEQRIGTWIDGKPLYQITFVIDTTTQVSSDKSFITLEANWNYSLKRGYGVMYSTTWGSSYSIPYLEVGSEIVHSYSIGESHNGDVNTLWITYKTLYATTAKFEITVEYTKPEEGGTT